MASSAASTPAPADSGSGVTTTNTTTESSTTNNTSNNSNSDSSGVQASIASAPGKVILFGEHAVVHGHLAVAAALSDLRIFVRVVSALAWLAVTPFLSL